MRKIAIAGFLAAALALPAALVAQGPSAPMKEHEWLHQLAGDWEADLEVSAGPGQPPLKLKSTDNTRRIGGYWIVTQGEVVASAMPFARSLTLGYDPQAKKFMGIWVDSSSTYLGKYEGSLDAAGKALTLEGMTPSPFDPSKLVPVREVIELKGPDQKVTTTSLKGDDGNWMTLVTVNARRKK